MFIDFLLDGFRKNQGKHAIVWRDHAYSYSWLLANVNDWTGYLETKAVEPGSVVAVEANFSPVSVALILALIERRCIVVPLTKSIESKKPEFRQIAQVEVIIEVGQNDDVGISKTSSRADHDLLRKLIGSAHPGLVVFSSGSTGKSKAALHDFVPLLEKFKVPRNSYRMITFLLFDHLGGVNTLLYTLSNAGCAITVQDRSPDAICAAVERHRVEVLPTSPTFINLLMLSEAYREYDLSSLRLVTYGTEVMPESTLRRFHKLFPDIRLQQTYGLSEIGVLRSRSKSSDSLWVKIGGEGFETRVVDGMLEVNAESAMLGYLNAPTPFTEDGWLKTGDVVEEDGGYIRILGRNSEMINVGGEKVYPAEVESVLQMIEGVEDVAVMAESNPITGQIVSARVKIGTGETLSEFRKRMRVFCKDRLSSYKVPQKVVLVDRLMHGERFKKMPRVP